MLQLTVDWIVYKVLGLDPASHAAGVLHFFIYDSVKIMTLLAVMISLIGFLRSYLPPHKVKQWLGSAKALGNLAASVFGAVTPFCSCSSIPMFLGFLKAGVPLGVTFSFLITSPLINEYVVVIMIGSFGWKITGAYVLSGIFMGVVLGMLMGRMRLEKYLVQDFSPEALRPEETAECKGLKNKILFGVGEAVAILKKLWLWILVGVGLGALIHNFVPEETIQAAISKTGIFSVPIAVILGIPMYASCAAIVPVAVVLFEKGIPLGTALAFMMAIVTLSLPEAILLRRAMKLPMIAIFFGVVTTAIVVTGYLLNALQPVLT